MNDVVASDAANVAATGAEVLLPALVRVGFGAPAAAAALLAPQICSALTAFDLGLLLTAEGAFPNLDEASLTATLRSAAHYSDADLRAALERRFPPDTVTALVLDGSTGVGPGMVMTVPDAVLGAFTVAAWILPEGGTGQRSIIGPSGAAEPLLGLGDGTLRASLGTADTVIEAPLAAGFEGSWVHVALTWDGATLTLYRYGLAVGSRALPQGSRASGVGWSIGHNYVGSLRWLTVWSEALTPADLQTAMVGMRPRPGATFGCWPLDDGAGESCRALLGDGNPLGVRAASGAAALQWASRPALPDALGLAVLVLRYDKAAGTTNPALAETLHRLVPQLVPAMTFAALKSAGLAEPDAAEVGRIRFPALGDGDILMAWLMASPTAADPRATSPGSVLAAAHATAARAVVVTAAVGSALPVDWVALNLKRAGYSAAAVTAAFRRPNLDLDPAEAAEVADALFHTPAVLARRLRSLGSVDLLAWLQAAYPDLAVGPAAEALAAAGFAIETLGLPLGLAYPGTDADTLADLFMSLYKLPQ